MTTAQLHAKAAAPLQRLASQLQGEWSAFVTRRAKRATVRILDDLSDDTLRDIGMSRGEICSVVYGDPGDRLRRYGGR